MWPVRVVVIREHAKHALQVSAIHDQEPVEAFRADGTDEALGDRVRLGSAYRRLDDPDAFAGEDCVKSRLNLLSRSRIRKRNCAGCSWSVHANWRACWVTQSPVGLAVQPARWTRRLASSMKKSDPPWVCWMLEFGDCAAERGRDRNASEARGLERVLRLIVGRITLARSPGSRARSAA
jgi:hypothetical protein